MVKIVAEIGQNHNGELSIAKRLIDIAQAAGCDYVKFQKREPDVCVPERQKGEVRKTPWGDMTYLEYRKRLELSPDDYCEISEHCRSRGIQWFASVWDIPSAIFLSGCCDIVKIPSACITDDDLLVYCRKHFRTLILSTAMSTEEEIDHAVSVGAPDVIMHCHAAYPAPVAELNLKYIEHLQTKFGHCEVGYSGHENGLVTTFAAVQLGATWVERHITIDHDMWGSDHRASVEPVGLFKLVKGIRDIEAAQGSRGRRDVMKSEIPKKEALRK